MKQVNQFILEKSPVTHYIEWAKKEECWEFVKSHEFVYDLSQINGDLIDSKNPPIRKVFTDIDEKSDTYDHEMGIIRSIPVSLWQKIADWGQESGYLAINYQSGAKDIAYKLKYHHLIAETDRRRAMAIYEIVCQHNIELLDEADELAKKDLEENMSTELQKAAVNERPVNDITIELIQEMVEWDRKKRILEDWKWKVMEDVAKGKKTLTNRYKYTFYLNLEQLRKKGFPK